MKVSERKANRERWRGRIDAWHASGEGLSAWARAQGFSRDALEYWQRQFADELAPVTRASRALTLIPVPSAVPIATPSLIEMVFETRPGLRLAILPGFDVPHLVRLLDVLAPQC